MEDLISKAPGGGEPLFSDYLFPKVSIVVPTFNSSRLITHTIESVLSQAYPDLELIVVDGGSTDKTLEIVGAYFDSRMRMCTVAGYDPYEMLNKGISLASGDYLQFLIPGNYILSENSIKQQMATVCENHHPHLVYGAHVSHEGEDTRVVKHPLREEILRLGIQPTTLSSCWFKKEAFQVAGKFDTRYKMRGDFDYFCRFVKEPSLVARSSTLVSCDTDLKELSRKELIVYFKETFRSIRKNFGFYAGIKWLFYQRELGKLMKLWFAQLKRAFVGERG